MGFDGLIVSDCDSIKDAYATHHYVQSASAAAAEGIKGGCDLVSPFASSTFCAKSHTQL